MEKLLQWISKHKLLTVLIGAAIFFAPLLVIHILFLWNTGIDWLVAQWTPGDLMGYIAGFEALLGTVILGIITVKQSQDAQKMNERLSKENNYLQKISVQRLLPIIEIPKVVVKDAQEISSDYAVKNTILVSESVSSDERKTYIDIYTTPVGSNKFFRKVVKLTLKNISDGIIRKITVEQIIFPHFRLNGEYVQTTVCAGLEKYNAMSNLLLPGQEIEVLVRIYFDDVRLMRFWEMHESNSIGAFQMDIYLNNITITGIEYKEKIVIDKGDNFKEKVMYKAYEEGDDNA